MNIKELYARINELIPPSLSCEWDNDGLSVCPDGEREVRRVLVTMDITADTVKYAVTGGFDIIISHHPLLFHPLKAVDGEDYHSRLVIELMKNNIATMAFHTRFDAVDGGVNDTLAGLLGLRDTEKFGEDAIGRIGHLDKEVTLAEFASVVKNALDVPAGICAGDRTVYRVAVLGGAGSDDADDAFRAGADTFVTGELKYHQICDACGEGRNLIMAGHFHTEFPVCGVLHTMVKDICPGAYAEIYNSDRIRII